MDTNIDNYDIEDLYKVYKLKSTDSCDARSVYNKTITSIKKIKESDSIEDKEKESFYIFIRDCFYKFCTIKNIQIDSFMEKNLQINTQQVTSSNNLHPPIDNQYNTKILDQKPYIGSLPEPIVDPYSVNVNNDKYVRGTVNPLKRETIKNILTINSKYRDNNRDFYGSSNNKSKYVNNVKSTSTDFTVELNDTYYNVVSLKLASMELMNAYYAFSEYLNTIRFTISTYEYETLNPSNITNLYSREIVIPEGQYTTATMKTTLNAIFSADVALAFVETYYDFMKGKFIFRILEPVPPLPAPTPVNPAFSYGFDLDFSVSADPYREIYLNMGWMLGYRKQKYTFFDDYNTSITPTSLIGYNPEAPTDFTGTKFFLLEVDDHNKNNPSVFKYNFDSKASYNINNIIAKIPHTALTFNIIFEDSSDRVFKTRKYFGPVKISKLHFKLLDDNGRVIDLNRSDIVISLEIETLEVPYKNMVY